MGLMDLFGKGPLTDKKIEKIAKLAANPFAQPDVRMKEMQRLLSDGSRAAIRGALKRFASNASGAIADEDEKKWLEEALVELAQDAVEPLRDYIQSETQLTYALRAYRRITGDAESVRFFIEVLVKYGPEDYRSGDAKQQFVLQLEDNLNDARVLPALVPFLHDHADEVRWAVMDCIEKAASAGQLTGPLQATVAAALGALVLAEDVGPRIQLRAADILANREWQIGEGAEELVPFLADTYFLDKKRFVRRRAKVAKN